MIIYPPFIAETIPGFTTLEIKIPFSKNPAVSEDEIEGYSLIVKNYNDSLQIAQLYASKEMVDTKSEEVRFNIEAWRAVQELKINTEIAAIELQLENNEISQDQAKIKQKALDDQLEFVKAFPKTGQYYKFQLGYVGFNPKDDITYSTASIGRCIGDLSGIEISLSAIGNSNYLYQGKYITSVLSEPLYSYRFILTNTSGSTIIEDTGEILHNVDRDAIADSKRTSTHEFKIKREVTNAVLKYVVTTVNGYVKETLLGNINTADGDEKRGYLILFQDSKAKNNGYVGLKLSDDLPSGYYLIERKKLGTSKWDSLIEFELKDTTIRSELTWGDCSVEHGETYQYAIRTYDSDTQVYGTRYLTENTITIEFEDMFLTSEDRQLNIKYNPKVSSVKNTILEQKTDTIGSKYPFFFRNGAVNYKELPISGLLSYLQDADGNFMSKDELGLEGAPSIQLDNKNIAIERKFKLQALEWLTNGEPKLFRSPTEGNYIVRLMKVSLSPNDTLGRMLHTFSATAYEMGSVEIEDMLKNNIIKIPLHGNFRPSSALGLFVLGLSRLG